MKKYIVKKIDAQGHRIEVFQNNHDGLAPTLAPEVYYTLRQAGRQVFEMSGFMSTQEREMSFEYVVAEA